ncbi:ABC transporter permease [Rhodopseudomonas boonkerdii]|uniref:ABC transporter permease n=1 Tax=Rhodopseudomonas boonkerdii TaxID=475937 RepID=UPI001E60D953|nr:ABC transporter permease [Rhodopseudomonas boonkerdii]UGV25304.1 ABC transporter permease [Rhodopseudomonas boonkerdii]
MSALRSKSLVSDRAIGVLSPLILLGIWEICARAAIVDARFFPAPSLVTRHLIEMIGAGDLWRHLGASLYRLVIGFFVGCVPAIAIGLAIGLYRPIRAAFDPLISATYPIPKSSLLPLILLVFGLGESSKIAMVAIGVFYPVVINTAAGVRQIAPIFLDVGRNFGANQFNMFRTVALPGALPMIMTGVKLGAGMGLVLIAIAEMVGAKSGLGYMIWNAWELFDVQTMYVGLFVIAIIGFLLNAGFDMLERVIVPWRKG